MSDKTFTFSCSWVMRDGDGNLVEERNYFPPQRSEAGWECPEEDCDWTTLARWYTDGEIPECRNYSHDEPLTMRQTQVLQCPGCLDPVPAHRFLDHVFECTTNI